MIEVSPAEQFGNLRALARFTRLPEQEREGRDQLIRFLDAYEPTVEMDPIVDSLCAHFGLYPYLSPEHPALSTSEALALEFHRPPMYFEDERFVFHADQAAVFFRLLDGENVILSAPTSFGKSAILDALVASEKWNNLVVIVPTVALIDEVRRRLVRFAARYRIITHPSQEPAASRNIYVLTQERYLELPEDPEVDLFMIDEFYKLGSHNPDDQRMSMLNIAWNRLRATGAQYYLTGPNVDTLAEALDGALRESLYVSDYRTVAVDVEDRSHVVGDDRMADMATYWATLEGQTLVFVSAPSRAERAAMELTEFDSMSPPSAFAASVAEWMGANFHPAWRVAKALKRGVAVHTGPMPRSLQRIMVRLFADRAVSTLVCTSTLIEGVNTSAKNVIVFDKSIDRKPIDYFTFSNVRGRAGRMSSHRLGRVITYMPPPAQELMEVDIPIDSQSPEAPLSSIVQLPWSDLSRRSQGRLAGVVQQGFLSIDTIRENRGFDPDLQIEAARVLHGDASLRRRLEWNGYPTNSQAWGALEFGFTHLLTSRQKRGMSVGRLWKTIEAVREFKGDLGGLVKQQYGFRFNNEDISDVVAGVLAFQRNWMGFTVPSFLTAAQRIRNEVAATFGDPAANYELYVAQIESLFLAPGVLDLDEYGLPLPLSLKFAQMGMRQSQEIAEVLDSFASLARRDSVRARLSDVELWIVDDVLAGLGAGV